MVNIESFTCITFMGIDIQILQCSIDKSMLVFLQCGKKTRLKPMVNIDNNAIFITFFTYGKNQLHFDNVLLKMHPTTDQDMGNKPMLVQKLYEQHLVPLIEKRPELVE